MGGSEVRLQFSANGVYVTIKHLMGLSYHYYTNAEWHVFAAGVMSDAVQSQRERVTAMRRTCRLGEEIPGFNISGLNHSEQEVVRDAKAMGVHLGHDFATGFERYLYTDGEWVNRQGENVHEYVSECFSNYSQYSPWEVTAAIWNGKHYSDSIWEAFDAGLIEGATGVDSGD